MVFRGFMWFWLDPACFQVFHFIVCTQKLVAYIGRFVTTIQGIKQNHFCSLSFSATNICNMKTKIKVTFLFKSTFGKSTITKIFELTKTASCNDNLLILWEIFSARFFVILDTWSEFVFIYSGVISGWL